MDPDVAVRIDVFVSVSNVFAVRSFSANKPNRTNSANIDDEIFESIFTPNQWLELGIIMPKFFVIT